MLLAEAGFRRSLSMTLRHPIAAALLGMTLKLRYDDTDGEFDAEDIFEAVQANIAVLEDCDIECIVGNLADAGAGYLATQLLVIHGNYKKRAALPEDSIQTQTEEWMRPS